MSIWAIEFDQQRITIVTKLIKKFQQTTLPKYPQNDNQKLSSNPNRGKINMQKKKIQCGEACIFFQERKWYEYSQEGQRWRPFSPEIEANRKTSLLIKSNNNTHKNSRKLP